MGFKYKALAYTTSAFLFHPGLARPFLHCVIKLLYSLN